jgi:hypothetical protein
MLQAVSRQGGRKREIITLYRLYLTMTAVLPVLNIGQYATFMHEEVILVGMGNSHKQNISDACDVTVLSSRMNKA